MSLRCVGCMMIPYIPHFCLGQRAPRRCGRSGRGLRRRRRARGSGARSGSTEATGGRGSWRRGYSLVVKHDNEQIHYRYPIDYLNL